MMFDVLWRRQNDSLSPSSLSSLETRAQVFLLLELFLTLIKAPDPLEQPTSKRTLTFTEMLSFLSPSLVLRPPPALVFLRPAEALICWITRSPSAPAHPIWPHAEPLGGLC